MRLLPKNVTARSLTAHYENLNLDLRKDDASDDSSLSSEEVTSQEFRENFEKSGIF